MLEGWHVGGRHRGCYYADNFFFLNSLLLVLKELSQAFYLNSSDGTIKCAIVGKPSTAVINGNSVVITAESLDHFVRSLFSSCFCHHILLEVIFQFHSVQGRTSKGHLHCKNWVEHLSLGVLCFSTAVSISPLVHLAQTCHSKVDSHMLPFPLRPSFDPRAVGKATC